MKLKLKKGLTLNIKGAVPEKAQTHSVQTGVLAVFPDDYPGLTPKVYVRQGDTVNVGSALIYDKNHPELKLVSPVAGTVKDIIRGERRKIIRVEIAVGPKSAVHEEYISPSDGESARRFLAESGLMALIRRRPFDIIAFPDDDVRDVFVTAVDTAPLASAESMIQPYFTDEHYAAGVELLKKICKGNVYVSRADCAKPNDIPGAEMADVQGGHPAGNAGVQAANIRPVNKGETIWTLDLPTLGRIGKLAITGSAEWRTTIAVTGPEVINPYYAVVTVGSGISAIVQEHLDGETAHKRIISGNVLTGIAVTEDSFVRYPYRQITVIAEGDDVDEFMGWASLSPSKMSQSPSFPGHFRSSAFAPDARINGGRRAMIMSGQYDRYVPMDIIPEYLIKAIIARDIDRMEQLGIYEVAPEDFAAAEYADTSKLPLQQIVRQGLDYLRKETE